MRSASLVNFVFTDRVELVRWDLALDCALSPNMETSSPFGSRFGSSGLTNGMGSSADGKTGFCQSLSKLSSHGVDFLPILLVLSEILPGVIEGPLDRG